MIKEYFLPVRIFSELSICLETSVMNKTNKEKRKRISYLTEAISIPFPCYNICTYSSNTVRKMAL